MCTHTRQCSSPRTSQEIASSKSRAVTGSMVKVGSAVRSRRGTSGGRASWAARSTPGGNERRRPRSSMSASMTSRATSGRPSRRAILKRPPLGLGCSSARRPGRASRERSTVARRPRWKNGSPTRKRPRCSSRTTRGGAWVRTGTWRPRRPSPGRAPRPCASSDRPWRGTSGMMPLPCETPLPPRLRPLGVKYCPAVMSSAPPLESSRTSWKTPLPKVSVPTTFARSRSCRAPVTISEAEAVPLLTSTATRRLGHHGIAGGAQRLLLDRAPARGDDRARRRGRPRRSAAPRRPGRRRCRADRARRPWRRASGACAARRRPRRARPS